MSQLDIKVTEVSEVENDVKIVIPQEKFEEKLNDFYKQNKNSFNLPGFRKGKVPKTLIGKRFRKEIQSEMVQDAFAEALTENKLEPVVPPEMREPIFGDDGQITISFRVESKPKVPELVFDDVEVEKERVIIDEEAITNQLESLRVSQADYEVISDRDVTEGEDWVDLEFKAWKDDENPEEIEPQENNFHLADKELLPGLAENLTGKKKGELLTFSLDVPEDHPNENLKGKSIHFEATVKEIKKRVLPELDDEFAKDQGDFETLDAYKEHLRDEQRKREGDRLEERFIARLYKKIRDRNPFMVPPTLVERQIDNMLEEQFSMMLSPGFPKDKLPIHNPQLRATVKDQAENLVASALLVDQITEKEGLTVSDGEVEDFIAEKFNVDDKANITRMKAQWIENGQWDNFKFYLKERNLARMFAEKVTVKEVDPIKEPEFNPDAAGVAEGNPEAGAVESAEAPVPAGFKESEGGLVLPEGSDSSEEE